MTENPFPKGVGRPAIRAFHRAGYEKVSDLAGVSEASLLELHGVGKTAIEAIRRNLAERDLKPLTE